MSLKVEGKMEDRKYQLVQVQKDKILGDLKKRGCRITRQRSLLLDIILENECSCCKEIYYQALKVDDSIGIATIYRLVNTLEEIGVISRKNMYKVSYSEECSMEDACTVVLDDDTTYHLSAKEWHRVIKLGLSACGYRQQQGIRSVTTKPCQCESQECATIAV